MGSRSEESLICAAGWEILKCLLYAQNHKYGGGFLPGCGLCSGFEWERLQEMQVWLLKTPLAVNLLFGFLPFLLLLFGQTLNNGEYM